MIRDRMRKWDKEDWFIAGVLAGFFLYALMHVMYELTF